MPISPERELEDFLAPLAPWLRKVLRWDYASLTPEEWLEHNRQQDETSSTRVEYERLLRQMRPQWNEYCRAQKSYFDATTRIEAKLTLHARALGRPSKGALATEAARLKDTGLSYAKVAAHLNRAGNLKPADSDYATGESVRKLLNRHRTSPGPTPDKTRN